MREDLFQIESPRLIRERRFGNARPAAPPPEILRALANDLRRAIEGEVRFDNGARALYATDGSNYRQLPLGVVIPRSKEDVIQTVALCRKYEVPVLSRGGGTSLAGQTCNVAVVMDFSKYLHGIREINPDQKWARVLPGTVLDDLRAAANRHDLTFGPDPATHDHCTLGGMMGNNSCGPHSVIAGRVADNVLDLEVLTYDGLRLHVGPTDFAALGAIADEGGRRGEIYHRLRDLRDKYAELIRRRYPKIPRRVSGYNLDELLPERGFHVGRALIGSESTLVTILEARLRLVEWPRARSLLVLGFADIYEAADRVPEIMQSGPIALEAIDQRLVDNIRKKGLHNKYLRYMPDGRGWLLVEFGGGTKAESDARAFRLIDYLRRRPRPPQWKLYDDPDQEQKVWQLRESGLGATARVPGERDTWPGWEDSSCPPERLGEYLRALRRLYTKYGLNPALYGHFGQACVHCRVDFDMVTADGIKRFRAFMEEAADLVSSYGGSLSGEHGDGQSRAELLPRMFGPDLMRAFREFKSIWDPEWRMNPGKVVEPYRLDENLRLGPHFEPHPAPDLHFHYPDDDGDFTRATLRCVGVGKCRREGGGTMCPSYMVTREEEHSTRGRAHLLFEMMRGRELHGWRDPHVRESLDLCLACKGCKGECPVNVDLATYKAEFLAHYYQGRLRPRPAYSMGLIYWWARAARFAPGLANLVLRTSGLSTLAKRIGGIEPRRQIPPFARRTFKDLWQKRAPRNIGARDVLLWPDTWSNHFLPETALAAAEVLEKAGFHVIVPRKSLCCGRPLYDFGFLGPAKRLLRQILDTLREPIENGVPLIGLEPSCVSVFRDELHMLFPNDPDADRLRNQTHLFGEFLTTKAPKFDWPRLSRKAVVHGHCHHKSLFHLDDEEEVLRRLGMEYEIPDTGCCGMAGAFGYEAGDKYEVSQKCGERVLLPNVRDAAPDTFIIADGFSCREQIAQATPRRALHIAEVVRIASLQGPEGPREQPPESSYIPPDTERARLDPKRAGAISLAMLGASGAGIVIRRVRRRGIARRVLGARAVIGALALLGIGSALAALAAARESREDR